MVIDIVKIHSNLYVMMITPNIRRIFTVTKRNSFKASLVYYPNTVVSFLPLLCETILLWQRSYLVIFNRHIKLPWFSAKSQMSMRNRELSFKLLNIYSIMTNHQHRYPWDTWKFQWFDQDNLIMHKNWWLSIFPLVLIHFISYLSSFKFWVE